MPDSTRPVDRATAGPDLDATAALPEDWRYETATAEVEEIVSQIEAGDLDLATTFDRFSLAIARLRECETFLNRCQQQVELFVETLDD